MKVQIASILPGGTIKVYLTVSVAVVNPEATCLSNSIEIKSPQWLDYDTRRAVIRAAIDGLHEHEHKLVQERATRALLAIERSSENSVIISITEEDDKDRPLSKKELLFERRADGMVICRNDRGVIPQIVGRASDLARRHFFK